MKLSELAKAVRGSIRMGDADILSLSADSRLVGEGDLFFCLRGTKVDSHAFAVQAEERGAAAVVAETEVPVSIPQLIVPNGREALSRIAAAFYRDPQRSLKIVGVTGTNGKTTTVNMLAGILEAAGRKVGRIGTLGAKYGETVLPPALTTPDPITLFSLLSDMVRSGVEIVVMEVSAHALALEKAAPIRFDLAVFTNLTHDHLDFFGDMRTYGAAKRKLFTGGRCREAVLNADDPFSRVLEREVPALSYGLEGPADNFAVVEEETLYGMRLLMNLEDELVEVSLPTVGKHNVYNALAAAVCARKLGVKGGDIARGLAACRVEGRLELVGETGGAAVFVDYAHTPDGVQKSLEALRPHCAGKLVLLFGCGGNRDRTKRPVMGEIAAKYADFSVITSDNPRYEDPAAIIAGIEEGFLRVSHDYVAIEDREEATAYALSLLVRGDILLVAGKGAETEQEIMGIKYFYNDKTVIKSLLEKL